MKKNRSSRLMFGWALLLSTLFFLPAQPGRAAEGASGLYLLGYQTPMSGYLPPPGFYFRNDDYYYNGSAGRAVLQGRLNLGISAAIFLDLFNFTYVAPFKLPGGGSYAATLVVPVGIVDLIGSVSTTTKTFSVEGSSGGLTDTLLTPLILGWHVKDFHFIFAESVYFPNGNYNVGRFINLGKNHWAFDTDFNVTWLDPKSGNEISTALGYTANLQNDATNYKTGGEFHADFGYNRHFRNGIALGATGYAYQQVTGDSGSGAILGPFKGRVVGLGPQISYATAFKKRPFSVGARYYREFLAKNRFEGSTFYLTLTYKLF